MRELERQRKPSVGPTLTCMAQKKQHAVNEALSWKERARTVS